MKFTLIILFLYILFSCNSAEKNGTQKQNIIFEQQDKEILEQVFAILSDEKEIPVSVLMIKVGTFFKETPYVAHTLEIEPDKEQLVINLREMDCNTFAENCLAISRTLKNGNPTFEKFATELQTIRYRDGEIDGYPSRLHYFSDWIFDNDKKKVCKSLSKEIAEIPFPKLINFMSTHPDSYIQLKGNNEWIKTISEKEKEISNRKMFYIPEEKLESVEGKLRDGDIVGITTNIKGLDIVHVGILIRKSGRIHLMHASSVAEKVVVSENTLEEYLLNRKSATGVMVSRPL